MSRSVLLVVLLFAVVFAGSSCVQLGQSPAAGQGSVGDLPAYPGAVQVEFKQGSDAEDGYLRKVEGRWTSTDAYSAVVAHYQKAITDGGWTVTEIKSNAEKTEWKLSKGTSVAEIEVKQAAPVTIKVERRDR